MNHNLRIFGLSSSRKYAKQLADYLDVDLSPHAEDCFADGECILKSNVNVRGCDVYVVQSLYSDEDQNVAMKFTNLLLFIGSLKDASAQTINVVVPYLAYSRQDRKVASREPISTKYLAQAIQAVGAHRILTMDVHNLSALQNAFYIPTDNLEAKNLLVDRFCEILSHDTNCPATESLCVLTPDAGGAVRAERFRDSLAKKLNQSLDLVYHDKRRIKGQVQRGAIIGDVKDRHVIIYDDMFSSFSTVCEASKSVREHGGCVYAACATHGIFTGNAYEKVTSSEIKHIVVTDTIDPTRIITQNRPELLARLNVVSTSKIFARAIRRIHDGTGSISELLVSAF